MRKRKKKVQNPVEADLPQNPEFKEFADNLRQIMSVPKEDVDRILAEEKANRKKRKEEPCE